MGAEGKDAVEQQIAYYRYCHERLDESRNSLYQRATSVMVILAFTVSAYAIVITDVFKEKPISDNWCYIVLAVCLFIWLYSKISGSN